MWLAALLVAFSAVAFAGGTVSRENALVLRLRQVISDALTLRGEDELPLVLEEPPGSGFAHCHVMYTPHRGTLFDRMAVRARAFRMTAGMRFHAISDTEDLASIKCGSRREVRGLAPQDHEKTGDDEGDYDELVPPTSVIILVSAVPCLAIVLIAGVMVVSFFMGNHPALKRVIYNFGRLQKHMDVPTEQVPVLPFNMPPPAPSVPRDREPASPKPQAGRLYGGIPDDY